MLNGYQSTCMWCKLGKWYASSYLHVFASTIWMSTWAWTWAYEQKMIFLKYFNDMDRIFVKSFTILTYFYLNYYK